MARYRRSAGPLSGRGMALVLVLWFLALLTVMVAAFSYSMRVESQTVANSVVMARGRAVAEAAVYWSIAELARPEQERDIRDDATPIPFTFGDGQAVISIMNESGLIDLNTASRELLGKLFMVAGGLDAAQAETLLDVLQDFRDPDDVKAVHGAETAEYERAGLPPPKNAPFESVEELQRVFGMNMELYRRLEPFLSVMNHSNGVNPMVASPELLLMLAEGQAGAVQQWLAQRETLNGMGVVGAGAMPPFGIPSYWAPARRNTYRISVDAGFPDGTGRSRLQVTAFVYPMQRPPYVINAWREQVP